MESPRSQVLGVVGSILIVLLPPTLPAVHAAEAVFTVDPTRSSITLQGTVLGFALSEQGPGSLTTSYEGTIVADLTETTLTFPGRGVLRARDNGTWQPAPGGDAGSAPANYAGKASSFLANAVAAARQVEFQLSSGALPLTSGQFESRQVQFQFTPEGPSTFDFNVTGLLAQKGQIALTGLTTNRVAGTSSLTTADGLQTLTIPVEATFAFTLLLENDGILQLAGQLVATRPVAEPGPTFDAFIAAGFPGITDPAIIGPDQDPDGDDLPNFVEFAFGLNPAASDAPFRPLSARIDPAVPGGWSLQYTRPIGLAGVGYGLETSSDLRQWTPVDGTTSSADLGNGRETVTIVLPRTPAQSFQYVRLTVTRT